MAKRKPLDPYTLRSVARTLRKEAAVWGPRDENGLEFWEMPAARYLEKQARALKPAKRTKR